MKFLTFMSSSLIACAVGCSSHSASVRESLASENAALRRQVAELHAVVSRLESQISSKEMPARSEAAFSLYGLPAPAASSKSNTLSDCPEIGTPEYDEWRFYKWLIDDQVHVQIEASQRHDQMPILPARHGDLIDDRQMKSGCNFRS